MLQDMDTYSFIVGFMHLYGEDMVPEPKIIQSALYACRRLDNFPMAMRVLEMVKVYIYFYVKNAFFFVMSNSIGCNRFVA